MKSNMRTIKCVTKTHELDESFLVLNKKLHYKKTWDKFEELKLECESVLSYADYFYKKNKYKDKKEANCLCIIFMYKNFILLSIKNLKNFSLNEGEEIYENLLKIINIIEKILEEIEYNNYDFFLLKNVLLTNYKNIKLEKKIIFLDEAISKKTTFVKKQVELPYFVQKDIEEKLHQIQRNKEKIKKVDSKVELKDKKFWIVTSIIIPTVIASISLLNSMKVFTDFSHFLTYLSFTLVISFIFGALIAFSSFIFNISDRKFKNFQKNIRVPWFYWDLNWFDIFVVKNEFSIKQKASKYLNSMQKYKIKYNAKPFEMLDLHKQKRIINKLMKYWYFGEFLINVYQDDETENGEKIYKLGQEITKLQSEIIFKLTGKKTIYFNEILKMKNEEKTKS